jgi:hypothetical protein
MVCVRAEFARQYKSATEDLVYVPSSRQLQVCVWVGVFELV